MKVHLSDLIQDARWGDIWLQILSFDENGEWACELNRAELELIYGALARVVPKRTYGDGVETFEDFIYADELTDKSLQDEVKLLDLVQWALSLIDLKEEQGEFHRETGSDVIEQAVSAATEMLVEAGIEYHGFHDTLLFYRRDGTPHQISRARFDGIKARQLRLQKLAGDGSVCTEYANEDERYPWRVPFVLHQVHDWKHFGINTAMDHALNILRWYWRIECDLKKEDDSAPSFLHPENIWCGVRIISGGNMRPF